jgi:DNA-binding CsgD family transcriptional regulator
MAFVLSAKGDLLCEIGDAPGSLMAFGNSADLCEANLAWVLAVYPVGTAAFVCVEYGRLLEARDWLGRAIALLPRSDDLPYELICVAAAAFVANRVDDAPECRRLARHGYLETAFKIGGSIAVSVGAAFAEQAAFRKHLDEARETFARCLRAMPSAGPAAWPLIQIAWVAQLPELASLRDAVASWAAGSTSPLAPAHLAILDARCAAASGRKSEAVVRAREAATLFARIDSAYFSAQALELAGDGAAALQEYRRAGAGRDVRRLDEILSPAGRRGRSSVEMSRREREVADLVALGLTNKAIAAKLVISDRTVENHVSSVFHKLGVSTRAELAARAKNDST